MAKAKRYTNETKIWKDMTVKETLEQFSKAGFSARALGQALHVYRKMLQDKKCLKIVAAAGALVPGGMRNVFVQAIKSRLFDVLVVPCGSIIDHDLIEAFGIRHEQGSPLMNDVTLHRKNVNRIYDVYLPNKGYLVLEDQLKKIFKDMPPRELSPSEFLFELGKKIKDDNSIIANCAKYNIPIFDPSITDSLVGFHAWIWSQTHEMKINPQHDIRDFLNLVWKKGQKHGALVLGGGVPKHFVAYLLQAAGKPLNYAIQITMSRPEYGGLSGAPLREAKSWGKVAEDALTADVLCDATIAFPLIVAALL